MLGGLASQNGSQIVVSASALRDPSREFIKAVPPYAADLPRRPARRLLWTAVTLTLVLAGCVKSPAPPAPEVPPPQEHSLGARVKAVGTTVEQSVREGERRNREAVDAAQ